MVALESVAGSAPGMEDSEGDSLTPKKRITRKMTPSSSPKSPVDACGISCSNEVENGGDNEGEVQLWG